MEQWKDIEQMPGYQVSTLGRVKRLAKMFGVSYVTIENVTKKLTYCQ